MESDGQFFGGISTLFPLSHLPPWGGERDRDREEVRAGLKKPVIALLVHCVSDIWS